MHCIVSLLDPKHHQLVKDLWAELRKEFAVSKVYQAPEPHFSYQLARHYNVKSLEPVLRQFAASKTSFQVRAAGLGIFTKPRLVLYIPVVRSSELMQFHEALWQEISSTGSGVEDYYHPSRWMPHITLGIGDINKDNLSGIVRFLAERDFNWEITIDNIGLVYGSILFPLVGTKVSIFSFLGKCKDRELYFSTGNYNGLQELGTGIN
ncbi:MAG: 2'-5' RNA ligase family protein [Ktedonobacteraceae bacterium]